MKIVSWNMRGLGRLLKRAVVKIFLCRHKVDIVLLQETKLSTISEAVVKEI